MRITYTYTVFYWTGSYNAPHASYFTLADAQTALGHSRNGYIGKTRHVIED